MSRLPLLILDLDQTLIYANKCFNIDPDFTHADFYVYYRPYLREFLQRAQKLFELAIWTAGSLDYAIPIIGTFGVQFKFVLTRESCTQRISGDNQIYLTKDLKKIKRKGYDLQRILIVDDNPETYSKNYGNGIAIRAYHPMLADHDLISLLVYLQSIHDSPNFRMIDKRGWRLKYDPTGSRKVMTIEKGETPKRIPSEVDFFLSDDLPNYRDTMGQILPI